MAKKLKIISYIGSDIPFFEEMTKYFSASTEHQQNIENIFNHYDLAKDDWCDIFLDEFQEKPAHLIFFDFFNVSQMNDKIENICKLLLFLRKIKAYQSIPIVGLFANKNDLNDHKYLYTCGMVYAYVKREKKGQGIFRDSSYLAFDDMIYFQRYARAKEINLEYPISLLASLNSFNTELVNIEHDISLTTGQEISANFNLFPAFKGDNFEVFETFTDIATNCFDFLRQSSLKIPYAGPWDEITENTLYKDTFETWIESNCDTFAEAKPNILVVNNHEISIKDIFNQIVNFSYNIIYRNHLKDPTITLPTMLPEVIIVNLDNVEEESDEVTTNQKIIPKNDMDLLLRIMETIKSIPAYATKIPMILAFNCPSGSNALQKAYNYNMIMAPPIPLKVDILIKMLEIYQQKNKPMERSEQLHYLKLSDVHRFTEIKEEVTITSLTEHEVTFLSTVKFPLYTTLKIDVPMDMYLTIVPPTYELDYKGNLYHYMAFIQGVDEEDLKTIRRFVNQIIFEPLTEFKYVEKKLPSTEEIMEERAQQKEEITKKEKTSERYEVSKANTEDKESKL